MRPVTSRPLDAARLLRAAATMLLAAGLAGCVATTALKRPDLSAPAPAGTRVLLMTPNVELSEVTAAGLEEPNAEWTALGTHNVASALAQFMGKRKVQLVPYREPDAGSDAAHAHVQLQKLHEAVGGTILVHRYNQAAILPTKADRFDWTLGTDTRRLRQEFGADYALFLLLHDSYASGGRVAMIIAMAAFGVAVHGGIQRGFASLVDLRTGDVAWFNVLVRGAGDLRTPESASDAVSTLLAEVPL